MTDVDDAFGIGPQILAALQAAGHDVDHLEPDALSRVDEYHTLGRSATVALADAAGIRSGELVLDVGAGLAGPARVLAARYGCTVVALDWSQEFCAVAQDLTARCHLRDRVSVQRADALDLPVRSRAFDVVWMQHVSMNVADKAALYRELRRALRPGGRLASFEVVAGAAQPILYPVPWADRSDESFVVHAQELRDIIRSEGFTITSWQDVTEEARRSPPVSVSPDDGLGLHLVIRDASIKIANHRRNLDESRVELVRIAGTVP